MADSKKDTTAVFVSIAGIIGLVVLNIFAVDVPMYVNIILGGAILGYTWEDIRDFLRNGTK